MFISQEDKLIENQAEINLFWQQQVVQDKLLLSDHTLHYAYVIPAQAIQAVVISSGRIESLLKYQELIWELAQNNYAVFIIDHRGQGLSSRDLVNPHKGYIADFKNYTDDFSLFNQQIVDSLWHGKKYLLAHSMGSAIATLYLDHYPHRFSKVALCGPMFGIDLGKAPAWLAKGLTQTFNRLGAGKRYFIDQGDYLAKPFSENELTTSALRYQLFRQTYQANPVVQLGGVTVAWLNAAFIAMEKLSKINLTLPTLVLQAGADSIVDNSAQNAWLSHNKHAQLKCFEQAKHELLSEQDKIRTPVMTAIYEFFDLRTTETGS
ncbi:alpha/beta fold hydrolase [Pseudoalteromonas tunicata]|uniref:alpha/beta fold hydrolase n=1 Tax=Pseudoalteromonas tunicata TaxID=314281 RepID=UPI00273E0CA4|nr:alpha/beta fold hydrolase [Pseudoalteromonas tunicata]MDP5214375.1 alpha/beta fold hydrolase [Pseudoalteromonas tunicata]